MKATDLRVFFSWALALLTMMVGARAVICTAETASTTSADVVYVNGTVLIMNATNAIAQAVAVEGEKIKAVGSTSEIQALIGPKTRVVDLAGKTLIPGFVDAHSHFPESGIRALYRVDCNSPPIGSTKSIADIISRLKEAAQKTPKGQWIQAFGYDDTLLAEKRHPTRDDLDQATTEHPVWLSHVSGHLGVANSLALAQTNITEATPDPKGGVIRRYPGRRIPTACSRKTPSFR